MLSQTAPQNAAVVQPENGKDAIGLCKQTKAMQTYQVENDVPLFGIQATDFPDGVGQAWQDLHKKLPTTKGRSFYGVSHGTTGGGILYKACVEEAFAGEAESLGCERFVLPKGEYIGETVHHFMQQLPKIGETFQALLARDDYDKANGRCVEQYLNDKDVVCMIKKAVEKK